MFKCFYDIFEDSLKGKRIKVRNYGDNSNWKEFEYGDENDPMLSGSPISWREDTPYKEWEGTVSKILQCDSGHFDIIFDKSLPLCSPLNATQDCFNWSLNDYLIIL